MSRPLDRPADDTGRVERLPRRGFLALSAVGAVATASLRPWRSLVEVRTPTLPVRLAGLVRDQQSAAEVGAAYLAGAPAERSTRVLVHHLRAAIEPAGAVPDRDRALRLVLDAAVRRDFELGATCRVDGWVLSLTEARLAALTAVSRGR